MGRLPHCGDGLLPPVWQFSVLHWPFNHLLSVILMYLTDFFSCCSMQVCAYATLLCSIHLTAWAAAVGVSRGQRPAMPDPAFSRSFATLCRLAGGLSTQQRRWLRRWFSCGVAAGLVAACASVALLVTELHALLGPAQASAAGADAVAGPRLQLALPGVTLPASHALPLWLALAVSLAAHEVRACGLSRSSLSLSLGAAELLCCVLPTFPRPRRIPNRPPAFTSCDLPAQAGHALAAAAEGVRVSGAGLSLLLLLPAAFVELDSADLAALSRASMLRVATAGVWHNAALGLACWAALPALPVSGGGGAAAGAVVGALLSFLRLLLGYTVSLSAALALLNMAPVHGLDGQQALEAALLRPRLPAKELPDHSDPGATGSGHGSSKGRRAGAVRWALHAGTAAYAAVVLLHMARLQSSS